MAEVMTAETPAPSRPASGPSPMFGVVVLAVAVGLVLAAWLPRIDATFGLGYHGGAGAVWGASAQAIADDGWAASALGGRAVGRDYASHPPGLVVTLGLVTSLTGVHEWSIRLTVVAASVVSVAALVVLARRFGLDRGAAYVAGGALIALPMMSTFGNRPDTWQVGLPLGIMAVARMGRRSGPWWAFAATVFSWQGLIVAGLIGLLELRRGRPWTAVATGTGLLVNVAWSWWVDGGESLLKQGEERVGVTFGEALIQQAEWLAWMIGPGVLLAVAGAVLVPRARPWMALTALGPVLWTVAFPGGAVHHPFWALWLVVPVALGIGAASTRVPVFAGALVLVMAVGGAVIDTIDEAWDVESAEHVDDVREVGGALTGEGYNPVAVYYGIPQKPPPSR